MILWFKKTQECLCVHNTSGVPISEGHRELFFLEFPSWSSNSEQGSHYEEFYGCQAVG